MADTPNFCETRDLVNACSASGCPAYDDRITDLEFGGLHTLFWRVNAATHSAVYTEASLARMVNIT